MCVQGRDSPCWNLSFGEDEAHLSQQVSTQFDNVYASIQAAIAECEASPGPPDSQADFTPHAQDAPGLPGPSGSNVGDPDGNFWDQPAQVRPALSS